MEYVNYIALGCSIAAFVLSLIAGARVGNFVKSTKDTDWETLANLTGDIAALKRTAQTLNNRLNGMNKSTIPQDQIIQQMLEHQNVEQIRRGG
jgi:arsenate reductase-like glutaredoxin family protein